MWATASSFAPTCRTGGSDKGKIAAAVINNCTGSTSRSTARLRDQLCEMVTLRVVAVAVDPLEAPKLVHGGRRNPAEGGYRRRTVFDNGEAIETPRYERGRLLADDTIDDLAALVVQHNSTTIVPPGYRATVMEFGDMLIRRG